MYCKVGKPRIRRSGTVLVVVRLIPYQYVEDRTVQGDDTAAGQERETPLD
jgi:hypothetical protein